MEQIANSSIANQVMLTKVCTRCSQTKNLSEFGKQASTKDGLKYHCKICDKDKNKKRYQEKHIEIIATVRKWQSENKEKTSQYQKKYKVKNLKFKV